MNINHQFVTANNIKIHLASSGDENAPLLVFLHGFPEFWYGWHRQIPFFAKAGYRVIAPDQRGYNLTEKPKGIKEYNLDKLAADVIGLIDHFESQIARKPNSQKAIIIGHDWGGMVAWWTALKYPDRVQKLVVLNAPHSAVMKRHLKTNKTQRRKSRYMFTFQLPWLPERKMRKNNFETLIKMFRFSSLPNTFTEEDFQKYREAWNQPGAITGMINWYRAMLRAKPEVPESIRVPSPTLLIWGKKDRFLGYEMAEKSIEFCDDGRLEFIEEATHWVQHEKSAEVNELILNFLKN